MLTFSIDTPFERPHCTLSLYEFAANWEVEYRNRAKFTDRDSDDEQAELDEARFLLEDADDAETAEVVATRPKAHLNREVLGDNKKNSNQRKPESGNHQYP